MKMAVFMLLALGIAAGFPIRTPQQMLAKGRAIEMCLQREVLLIMPPVWICGDLVLELAYVNAAAGMPTDSRWLYIDRLSRSAIVLRKSFRRRVARAVGY